MDVEDMSDQEMDIMLGACAPRLWGSTFIDHEVLEVDHVFPKDVLEKWQRAAARSSRANQMRAILGFIALGPKTEIEISSLCNERIDISSLIKNLVKKQLVVSSGKEPRYSLTSRGLNLLTRLNKF